MNLEQLERRVMKIFENKAKETVGRIKSVMEHGYHYVRASSSAVPVIHELCVPRCGVSELMQELGLVKREQCTCAPDADEHYVLTHKGHLFYDQYIRK